MKRPLCAVALFYVGGILLTSLPLPLSALFTLAFVTGILCLLWARARKVSLACLMVLAGWINHAQRIAVLSPDDLRHHFSEEALVTVRGILRETPRIHVHEIKDKEAWSSSAEIEVSEIREGSTNWHPAYGKIISTTRELLPETFFAGQTVEVSGVLRQPPSALAEGLFDYREYLKQNGIYHQLVVQKASAWSLITSPPHAPLADRFSRWARKTLALGLPAEDESLRLEWALTLGWKTALTEEVSEPFVKAATYHVFAVDGLRIAIISGILFVVLRTMGFSRTWCGLIAAPLLLFYAALTGWPASAVRAIVMIFVVFGSWIFKRPPDLINSLYAAALMILVWEPRQLFQAGFQLSFLVVLCIILILPFFNVLGERLLRPDPLRPEHLQPWWQKILLPPLRWIADLFLTSTAAWLGSIPLVVWYFHLVTPVSAPANVLAVPLCMLILICNLLSLVFAAALPSITILLNHAGWFFMECLRVSSHWFAKWPGAYFYAPMPNLFTIAIYYFLLLALLTGWMFQGTWRKWKLASATTLILIWCGIWMTNRASIRLTVLPLNGGHALYMNGNDSKGSWLIDCGNESSAQMVVKPFLQAQGVNRLSNLVLTHGEINYTGGAETILDLFNPKNIYTSSIHFRSPSYRHFQTNEKNNPAGRPAVKPGDQIGPWTVLYPPPETTATKAADNVLVLRGNFSGLKVLLLSDLGRAGQSALPADGKDLHADIVIVGLPGDDEPLRDALLDVIQPQIIIIADSQQPANKKAGSKLKERLAQRTVPVFYTSEMDAVTLNVQPQRWELKAMDGTTVSSAVAPPH